MTTTTVTCPECSVPQLASHPGGTLEFGHVPNGCPLGAAEDATRGADAHRHRFSPAGFLRPATPTERVLLAAVAGRAVPQQLDTRVDYLTGGHGIRRRRWNFP